MAHISDLAATHRDDMAVFIGDLTVDYNRRALADYIPMAGFAYAAEAYHLTP